MDIMGILAWPFGQLMRLCYNFIDGLLHLPLSYVFTMFLFAIITTAITFWPSLNQQKSSAKMAAIQPLMKEIQKKYPKDREKQQQAQMKLQQDVGYKMSAGCLPMVIMLVLMLAVVQVVYRPLTYMVKVDETFVERAGEIVQEIPEHAGTNASMLQNRVIALVQDPNAILKYSNQAKGLSDLGEKLSGLQRDGVIQKLFSGLEKTVSDIAEFKAGTLETPPDLAENFVGITEHPGKIEQAFSNWAKAAARTSEKYANVVKEFTALEEKYPEEMETVRGINLSIGGVNGLHLWDTPQISQPSLLWLMPLFSVIMLVLSMIVTNRASGAAQAGSPGTGKVMMIFMGGFSAITAFMWPAGFSLYWGMRSLVGIGQSLILRKIVDPEKIKKETLEKFNASKKARKELKSIKVADKTTGSVIEKRVSGEELNKLRLQRAREADLARYGEEAYPVLRMEEYTGAPAPAPKKEKKDNTPEPGEAGKKRKK